MAEERLLLTPGPVRVARSVRDAMSEPMFPHRSGAFADLYRRLQAGLEEVFERSTPTGSSTADGGTALVFNGTATLAMEAAVSNLAGPGDEVVALVNGKCGRRFARLAGRYADGTRIEVPWGKSFDLGAVEDAVSGDTAVLTMVHNETSTGLLNPVAEVGDIAAEHDARFVVDGVTSVGGDEFRIDDWGVDVAITDAQKALAAPPGLSAAYVTDEVAVDFDGDGGPLYGDLERHLEKAGAGQTPFTSAVPLFRAMDAAVEAALEEGLADRIARHRRFAAALREGFEAMGLDLFAEPAGPSAYSNTVTAIALPPAARDQPRRFFDAVEERGVAVAGGQAHLDGNLFRVSNMGAIGPEDLITGVRALGAGLAAVGFGDAVGAGVEATRDRL